MKKSDKDFIFGFKSKRFFESIIPIKDDEQKVAAMIEWVHLNDTLIVTYWFFNRQTLVPQFLRIAAISIFLLIFAFNFFLCIVRFPS